jgi:omega-hydroxy-beta-dihydromenaquinone-9 sulfotransferase
MVSADTVLNRMELARRSVGNSFGAWVSPLATGAGWWTLQGANAVGSTLDRWRYPQLAELPVERPVLLVGMPRSGTTFLHRFLVDNGIGVGQQLWQMLLPSPSLQQVVRPALPLLGGINPARFHDPAIHKTGLTEVETDDVSLLFRHFDGFFLYAFALAHAEQDLRELVDPALRDESLRDFDTWEQQWRRTLVATGGERIVAKLFSAVARLPAVMERFPDARVVLMVRDPAQTIPSTLSLVTTTLDAKFGFWKLPEPVRKRTLERLTDALVSLQDRLVADWQSGAVDTDAVHLVTYPELVGDFDRSARALLDFLGHDMTPTLDAAIHDVASRQRTRKSGHRYDLARFGLDPHLMEQRAAAVRELFLQDA